MPWPLMGTEALQGLAEAADKSLQVAWFQDQETGAFYMLLENRFDIIKGSLDEKLPIYERHPSKVK